MSPWRESPGQSPLASRTSSPGGSTGDKAAEMSMASPELVPGTWASESAPDDSSLGDLPDEMKGRVASRVFVSRETREGRGPQCH